ncbi:MAG: type II toxin-antitoxin system VapC family toxin [Terracidiphilus sp.]|jgi:PIN domain nuclease of toxin-antitoxin system
MILLDTHVVIWLMTSPERVSKAAAEAIALEGADGSLPDVSVATIYEIFYLSMRGRIRLYLTGAALLERLQGCFILHPVTAMIALEAATLPEPFHGDPVDRLIAATARVEGSTLVTIDSKFRAANVCKVLW